MHTTPIRPKLALIALAFAWLLPLVAAAPLPAADADLPKPIRQVEGVSEYALDNGLRVLLVPDPSQATVTVNITYLVGSMHEGYGETGAAHLLEHMVFKGTPTHPNVASALNDHGAQWNGSTWLDRTNYFETMPASDENVEFGVCFEADRMVKSRVSAEDLASEMTVVRNEWESGENSPRGVLFKRMQAVAYDWHGYGHSTIGARSDLEGIPIERLQAFYRTYYQPDNAILVVAGKFDRDKALRAIVRCFGAVPRPERELPPMYTSEPAQDGERAVTLRRVGEIAAVGAAYHSPPAVHADAAVLAVIAELLGAEPTGRLYEALVETDKATGVYAFTFDNRHPSLVWFFAELRKEQDIDEVRRVLREEVEGLAATEVTPEELETAKSSLLKGLRQLLNNSQWFAVSLSEWASMGDWRLFFIHRDRLEAVTAKDVVRVAGRYLVPTNATIGTYVPTDEPTRVEVASVSDEELARIVGSYEAAAELADAGEEFEATPANIHRHT
ncbi:MAG TPA: pitrilysin family protein, partial [Thermoanaerobaculia bacterium]